VFDDVVAILTALGTVVTAVAVAVGVQQLRLAEQESRRLRKGAQTSFEDDLSREYRALIDDMPAEVFYADTAPDDITAHRRSFYRYFDLSNEQLFLAGKQRVSPATTEQWEDGIAANLALPAFQKAWEDLLPHLEKGTFEDLRSLRRSKRVPGPVDPPRRRAPPDDDPSSA